MAQNEAKKTGTLIPQIGILAAVAFGIGSVIGSGIFKKPALMATQLNSPLLLILVWIVAGLMTLFGILSVAEIASMFPESGGQYIYFNKSYNRLVGYFYGWAVFIVIQTGSIASIAYIFSESLGSFFNFFHLSAKLEAFAIHIPGLGDITPFAFFGLKLCTIGLILFLTTINYMGVKLGSGVQILFTALKIFAIAAIIIFALTVGHGQTQNFVKPGIPWGDGTASVFLAFIVAMSGAFWAYDGWINVTYIAGEIKNPQKNVPRAMFIAALIFISIYILANLAYMYIIPVPEMAQRYKAAVDAKETYLVATDVARTFWGNWGGAIIALAIAISTFGTVNGTIMMSARVHYAMSKEGLFFQRLQHVHPRFNTPGPSLVVQGLWSSLLVLSGTFDQLTDMLIFVSWIFYGMAALGVLILRKRMPDAPRKYRVWGYPVVPVIFICFSMIYIIFTLYSDIKNYIAGDAPLINSLMGLVLVALGLPGYFFWVHKKQRQEESESKIKN